MTSPLRLCVRRQPTLGSDGPAITVSLAVPSDVTCVEEVVALVTRHCFAGEAPEDRTRFRLQVALSEALANAILRGNAKIVADGVRKKLLVCNQICVRCSCS